jgi:hypothetical protein
MARLQTRQHDQEIAFRAALMELAWNVQRLEAWEPLLQDTPPPKWLEEPLSLAALKDFLAHVWVPSELWNRVMGLMTNLNAYVEVITAQIHGLPPDVSTRGEYAAQRENIRNLYSVIDLYLKQLACYPIAEMRRQQVGMPQEWEHDRLLFLPLGWRYDVAFAPAAEPSVAVAVHNIESGPVWPPFTPQSPEPKDPAYRECLLERLIERARQKSDDDESMLRAAYRVPPEAE